MELREFIQNTITDIVGGVVDAQKAAKEFGGLVVPSIDTASVPADMASHVDLPPILHNGMVLTSIVFDIALTEGESSGSKGGVGVFLAAVGVGGQIQEDTTESKLSRIRFSIPVALPRQE